MGSRRTPRRRRHLIGRAGRRGRRADGTDRLARHGHVGRSWSVVDGHGRPPKDRGGAGAPERLLRPLTGNAPSDPGTCVAGTSGVSPNALVPAPWSSRRAQRGPGRPVVVLTGGAPTPPATEMPASGPPPTQFKPPATPSRQAPLGSVTPLIVTGLRLTWPPSPVALHQGCRTGLSASARQDHKNFTTPNPWMSLLVNGSPSPFEAPRARPERVRSESGWPGRRSMRVLDTRAPGLVAVRTGT